MSTKIIGDLNGGRTYLEQRERFMGTMSKAVAQGDFSFKTWWEIGNSKGNLRLIMFTDDLREESKLLSRIDPIENQFLERLDDYLTHDMSHTAPQAIVFYGMEALLGAIPIEKLAETGIPEIVRGHFTAFGRDMGRYFGYHDNLFGMGEAFFTPIPELNSLPQITGSQLPGFTEMIANAFTLRFLSAFFEVTTQPPAGKVSQHTLLVAIDPALKDMSLPFYLVAPKIVGDIKNCIRVVSDREMILSKERGKGYYEDASLARSLRGEKTEKPVLVKVEANKLSSKTWELRISDNGRGIVIEELLPALARACRNLPGAISPALKKAVQSWEGGNPFAFNNIVLSDFWESVFQIGVSAGTGREGSGIGLWGSMMLLLKLGAQIKVGIAPKTGGFYESIVLPMDLTVRPQEVRKSARLYWSSYY
ncbi:MAG: hypothetical protein WC624_02505 [Candidatus Margulisiibacteriota bacterium]